MMITDNMLPTTGWDGDGKYVQKLYKTACLILLRYRD